MRALITLIVAVCFFAGPAFAKEAAAKKAPAKAAAKVTKAKKIATNASKKKGKFKIRILSYAQISRLSKAKRAKYIRDIRELLITMEAYQQKYEVASNPYFEKLKEQVAWLMKNSSLVPTANAADPDQSADAYMRFLESQARNVREAKLKALSNVYPVFNGNEWTCGEGLRFDSWAGTCYLENLAKTTTFADAGVADGEVCPTQLGFHDVAHTSTTANGGSSWIQRQRACVPNGSFDRLKPDRQAQVVKGERLAAGFFNGPYTQAQLDAVSGGTGVPADAAATPVDTVVTDDGAPPPNAGDDTAAAAVDTGKPVDEDKAGDDAAAAATCQPAALACKNLSPEDKAAAIARFRSNGKTDDAVCVYGGFLSKYKGGVKKPGGCDPVNKLPYGERFGEKRPKCDAGRALCNPVAFCVSATVKKPDNTEVTRPGIFCVDYKTNSERNAPITETCNNEYQRMLRGEPFKDKNGKVADATVILEGIPGVTPKACDPSTFKDLPFQTEWDAMKADTEKLLNNWCTDKQPDVQALFCRECEILMEHLAKANADAGASNCVTAGDTPAGPTLPPVQEGDGQKEGDPNDVG